MKTLIRFALAGYFLAYVSPALCNPVDPPRTVDLLATDGTQLKASYFAATKKGPAVILFHQGNRDRRVWNDVARRLSAAGINALTLDMRGFGESGGKRYEAMTPQEMSDVREHAWPGDIDLAWQFLVSQPAVDRAVIGLGGAGWDGVDNVVLLAGRHPGEVKSMVLLSGETFLPGLQVLRQRAAIPLLLVADDRDEYPPTVEAMQLLYALASSRSKTFIHYKGQEAPWLGYEDRPGVPASGGHGTDMFALHPELPAKIVDWYAATLSQTGSAVPAAFSDGASIPFAPIINRLEMPGGVAVVSAKLAAARRQDPNAQLWPEIVLGILAADHLRAGEPTIAIEMMKLNLEAFPDSADAHADLASAYLAAGEKELARKSAREAQVILDTPGARASSWSNTEQMRAAVRRAAARTLQQLDRDDVQADLAKLAPR